ncbi:hypothetical protein L198_06517 [Cryptococcus wingfieldii CBS 7118]|uniref:Uncharacterized protein n=1 Tax=Cryptococcus wingfieldii CBS 7118 TaxID=1295528 RepID=A0A1E3IKR9_9TREE|nr:hypothetical protein L198_06517 [Cryptococcus wingfieldii CBS 7118]ODN89194.1 hypothetical protein L198_06517 [Cryptococcus wingfieldii CBS 7118]
MPDETTNPSSTSEASAVPTTDTSADATSSGSRNSSVLQAFNETFNEEYERLQAKYSASIESQSNDTSQ